MLRLQLDRLHLEKQALAAENARLRDEHPDGAALIDWEENGQLKKENDNLRQEMERLRSCTSSSSTTRRLSKPG